MEGLSFWSSFLLVFILSCQVFCLQKIHKACNSPLGIQNGQVPDNHFSASSYYTYFYIGGGKNMDMKAKYCRLNHQYAWCTHGSKRVQSWLMVDLRRITNVTAISTQGYDGVNDYFVKSFKLAYSIDGRSWKFVGKNGTAKEFKGNNDGLDIKNNTFEQIQARYIKVIPITYNFQICLRIELYGCTDKESFIPTTATLTTSSILASKVTTISKSATSSTITPKSFERTTSTTTKATSYKTLAIVFLNQTTSKTTSKATPTSSQTTESPSQHSTTEPSSLPVPTKKEPTTVATTTVHPHEGSTLINALQRKSSGDDKKKNYIIAGFSIFGLFLVIFLCFLIFIAIHRRRKRRFIGRCQLVNLPEYPYDDQVDCNGSVSHTLVMLENESNYPVEL